MDEGFFVSHVWTKLDETTPAWVKNILIRLSKWIVAGGKEWNIFQNLPQYVIQIIKDMNGIPIHR